MIVLPNRNATDNLAKIWTHYTINGHPIFKIYCIIQIKLLEKSEPLWNFGICVFALSCIKNRKEYICHGIITPHYCRYLRLFYTSLLFSSLQNESNRKRYAFSHIVYQYRPHGICLGKYRSDSFTCHYRPLYLLHSSTASKKYMRPDCDLHVLRDLWQCHFHILYTSGVSSLFYGENLFFAYDLWHCHNVSSHPYLCPPCQALQASGRKNKRGLFHTPIPGYPGEPIVLPFYLLV